MNHCLRHGLGFPLTCKFCFSACSPFIANRKPNDKSIVAKCTKRARSFVKFVQNPTCPHHDRRHFKSKKGNKSNCKANYVNWHNSSIPIISLIDNNFVISIWIESRSIEIAVFIRLLCNIHISEFSYDKKKSMKIRCLSNIDLYLNYHI